MPRPALSLYRQLPITYKQRSLLLDTTQSSPTEIQETLPHIISGFTGILTTLSQYNEVGAVQHSVLPKIIRIEAPQMRTAFKAVITQAMAAQASALEIHLEFGNPNYSLDTSSLQRYIKHAKANKLATIATGSFSKIVSRKSETLLLAYALRFCSDLKIDFLTITMPENMQDIDTMLSIAGKGNVLVHIPLVPAPHIKRILAFGASGVIVSLADISAENDPARVAQHLGEAVFGPGSYHPSKVAI